MTVMFSKNTFFCQSIFIFVCLLTACATPLQIAGEKHRSAAEKWKALSQYTTSQLPDYGFTVTASLKTNTLEGQTSLYLSKIKFDRKADNFSVDLLEPEFVNKYLCTPQCMQLVEYENLKQGDGDTLLAQYLLQYEFELFSFYGEMFVLNDVLLALKKNNEPFLKYYLSYLTYNQAEFSTLSEFTDYLKEKLTLVAFKQFINDPQAQYIALVNESGKKWNFNEGENTPDTTWNTGDLGVDPTRDWDLLATNKEQQAWELVKDRTISASFWLDAKDAPIEIGKVACTFKDNYFGIVQSVLSDKVEIFLQGQAKRELDGMVNNLASGSLFQETTNISFKPLLEKRSFPRSDTAPCNIQ